MRTGTGGLTRRYSALTKGRGEQDTPANLDTNYFLGIDAARTSSSPTSRTRSTGVNHPARPATHASCTTTSGTTRRGLRQRDDVAAQPGRQTRHARINVGDFTPGRPRSSTPRSEARSPRRAPAARPTSSWVDGRGEDLERRPHGLPRSGPTSWRRASGRARRVSAATGAREATDDRRDSSGRVDRLAERTACVGGHDPRQRAPTLNPVRIKSAEVGTQLALTGSGLRIPISRATTSSRSLSRQRHRGLGALGRRSRYRRRLRRCDAESGPRSATTPSSTCASRTTRQLSDCETITVTVAAAGPTPSSWAPATSPAPPGRRTRPRRRSSPAFRAPSSRSATTSIRTGRRASSPSATSRPGAPSRLAPDRPPATMTTETANGGDRLLRLLQRHRRRTGRPATATSATTATTRQGRARGTSSC